jgi:hypothetical protein
VFIEDRNFGSDIPLALESIQAMSGYVDPKQDLMAWWLTIETCTYGGQDVLLACCLTNSFKRTCACYEKRVPLLLPFGTNFEVTLNFYVSSVMEHPKQ